MNFDFFSFIDYFAHGGTNDNGRFYWHTETPPPTTVNPYSIRKPRLSDTSKIFFFFFFFLYLIIKYK
jgi:hypothetical protein